MANERTLVKTLDFQLNIQSDNESLLYAATLESRRAYNEPIRLAKQGVDWDDIPDYVADDADLVKNTTQRVVAKALGAMENYHEYADFSLPSHTKDGTYPLRANYEEGYDLTLRDDGTIEFRISAKPYKHVKGVLEGDDTHLDILRAALAGDEWTIGTAEALFYDETPELHVNVTNTERTVREKQDSRTVIGVDVNEDNVALSALSAEGVEDTLVIDFPEIKFERHRYFTSARSAGIAGESTTDEGRTGQCGTVASVRWIVSNPEASRATVTTGRQKYHAGSRSAEVMDLENPDNAMETLTGVVAVVTLPAGILAAIFLGGEASVAVFVVGWLLLVPVLGILSRTVAGGETATGPGAVEDAEDDALQRLRERYAAGEIDEAEFERRVERLLETEDVGQDGERDGSLVDREVE